ncbi:MAG: carbohydrate ABC transporter substrate-binding protein, partial [Alkalispirochaeta sp.]
MRRIISLVIVVALLAPMVFAGGQGEDTGSEERELVINSNLSDPAPKAAFETLVNRFREEYPDIDV